ncbi:aminobenzoyl-glutamate transport protein [Anaerobranca californiensis DSM 14826]|uniref:Aminobenzoyl-glutamate transport protein n=1 Tax=Anaerobranca californiensis DSM 14826 TaxID=1120989 RepID=A0A1M6K6W5_9FIRM|nr:AbgT family transporter [Anaerobranca californiensis]SHJ54701.1 aminobenzoyl-glutamate transport protein [Anaerobranca californiensis DSM 14826]
MSRKSNVARGGILGWIERVGNKLPHPITLFFLLAFLTLILSWIVSSMGVSVVHPVTGETVQGVNLLSREGIQNIFSKAVPNFTGFAPLGTVLVAMLGVGVADRTGLIKALLKVMVLGAPDRLITAAVVFAGIMSNIASDAGYVVLVPLGAIIFSVKGRHPLVGLAAAFAGVSGGFSANLLLSTIDPLLAGLTAESARILDPNYTVPPTVNWYFMIASTFLVTIVATWVTERIIAPRLGEYKGEHIDNLENVTAEEKKGLLWALVALLLTIAFFAYLTVPENGILRNEQGQLIQGITPFVQSMVPIIALLFFIPGLAFGLAVGTIKSNGDVATYLSKSMAEMGGYIALAFAAGQFVAYFNWSNIGTILAVTGAEFLQTINLVGLPLIVMFILVTGFINLFLGSASAKWAIMAPVFVPLFMQLGYAPEFTQLAYRIGDSVTNIISPLMPYFAIIIAFAEKYDHNVGIGTLISTMLPYAIALLIAWTLMLVIWFLLLLPIGPGGSIFL